MHTWSWKSPCPGRRCPGSLLLSRPRPGAGREAKPCNEKPTRPRALTGNNSFVPSSRLPRHRGGVGRGFRRTSEVGRALPPAPQRENKERGSCCYFLHCNLKKSTVWFGKLDKMSLLSSPAHPSAPRVQRLCQPPQRRDRPRGRALSRKSPN